MVTSHRVITASSAIGSLLTGLTAVTALGVLVQLEGCGGSYGSEDQPADSGAGAATDGSITLPGMDQDGAVVPLAPDAAPSLGCPLECLPPPPPGWIGPSAIYDGPANTKPADCPTPYTVREAEGHQGVTGAAATCACGTGQVSNAKCTAKLKVFGSDACNGTSVAGTWEIPGSARCQVLQGTVQVEAITYSATCTFPNVNVTRPPPTFDRVNVACGLPQLAACATRSDCVASPIPAQPFTRLCIHKPGEQSCPSLDYAVRVLAHRGVDDKRNCTCSGGTATGTCGRRGTVYDSQICTNKIEDLTDVTQRCLGTSAHSIVIDELAPSNNASCTGAQSSATGEITAIEPMTFCCNR